MLGVKRFPSSHSKPLFLASKMHHQSPWLQLEPKTIPVRVTTFFGDAFGGAVLSDNLQSRNYVEAGPQGISYKAQ